MKEAREILRVCNKTIQRWDKEGKIRCIRTPGNRRLIPESEILMIIGESKPLSLPKSETKTSVVEGQAPAPPAEKPKEAPPPAELPRHAILDALTPAGLAQRTAFGDLLSAAMLLKSFTLSELAARARCPEALAKTFCERMSACGYLASKNEVFELRVEVV